ncbi:hypothetical protein T4D_3723 [Trichinella pseudospiralis]|uniref:Uncharacterized protein n=1 Tax=Trichinella pseudospiralis TaxID=6337 RepID=A0A0V1FN00_TRIPS|nr:hypothetical protein T4D_3723 [Trichinella pseudospiralis]
MNVNFMYIAESPITSVAKLKKENTYSQFYKAFRYCQRHNSSYKSAYNINVFLYQKSNSIYLDNAKACFD